MIRAGVIAVQGDVSEHASAIQRAGESHGQSVEVEKIRQSGSVPDCDVLLLPGGESTAISRLLSQEGIAPEIIDHVESEKPVLATCAGLIVAAADANDDRVDTLNLIDATINRNAFGRQVDSFEAPLDVAGLERAFPAVFIRAPVIETVGSNAEILATWENDPVAIKHGPVVGTAFHPELTEDARIHDLAFFHEED
ncbi:MAG: pyridoxal 5''-phosphate synthase, glutaminase subunit Pdx2 [Haloquadratum sp. J07HQX50]|jgi:pyridoxal phosphate synthase yaaE subunit|nr:MAG: pyridoxal 5''-phosphate synthase, glutaminase subunit Pdx2 [Haloquadratum sp. J07HQX50]